MNYMIMKALVVYPGLPFRRKGGRELGRDTNLHAGHRSLYVGGKTQNSEVLMLGLHPPIKLWPYGGWIDSMLYSASSLERPTFIS